MANKGPQLSAGSSSATLKAAPKAAAPAAGFDYNGTKVGYIRQSEMNQLWSLLSVDDQKYYVDRWRKLGYNTNDPASRESAWAEFSSRAAAQYQNGRGIKQNMDSLFDELEAVGNVATTSAGAVNENTYATSESAIKSYLGANGVKLPDATIANYSNEIVKGNTTVESVVKNLRDSYVKGKYYSFADRIDAGENMVDIAAPWIQEVAQTLEMPDVDINNEYVQRALAATGADGKPTHKQVWELGQELRGTDAYFKTTQANNNALEASNQILSRLGLR